MQAWPRLRASWQHILVASTLFCPALAADAAADGARYTISRGQYEQVLIDNGGPQDGPRHITIKPLMKYFSWIEPGTTGSNGVNVALSPEATVIGDCLGLPATLPRIQGIMDPPILGGRGTNDLGRLAYAMTHDSWAFHADETLVKKFLTEGSDYFVELQRTDEVRIFDVGDRPEDRLVFYVSPTSDVIFGLCIKDTLHVGPACHTMATTSLASYELTLLPELLTSKQHLKCLIGRLLHLEREAEVGE